MGDLTPWEDINPPMALARQLAPRSAPLAPCPDDVLAEELTACLALVAPSGMTEDGRREWLVAARATLGHLPADMLRYGCGKARETCDHPAKIVATILAETRDWLESRRSVASAPVPIPPERQIEHKPDEPMTPADIAEMNLLMKRFGIATRYRDDGSTYQTTEIPPMKPQESGRGE